MNAETSNELRGLVREVLRETLVSRGAPAHGVETVSVSSEAELQAFVSRLASLGVIEAVRAGKLRFELSRSATARPTATAMAFASSTAVAEVVEGVVGEQRIESFAGKGTLILGPTAVLTPLARDKLRKLGLKVERRR